MTNRRSSGALIFLVPVVSLTGPAMADSLNVRFVGGLVLKDSARAACVQVSGRYAYVGTEPTGLHIVDVSDPRHPQAAGYIETSGRVSGRHIPGGGHALVVQGDDGNRVISIADSLNPKEVVADSLPGVEARGFCGIGNYEFVIGFEGGNREDNCLVVYDVSDTDSLREAGFYETPGRFDYYPGGFDVDVAGGYVYVADGSAGLQAYEFTGRSLHGLSRDSSGRARAIIDEGPCAENPGQRGPNVISDGDGFLVAWMDNRIPSGIYGTRITFDGKVLDRMSIPLFVSVNHTAEEPTGPAIASAQNRILVVCSDAEGCAESGLRGKVLALPGLACRAVGIAKSSGIRSESQSVVAGPDGFIVVWREGLDKGDRDAIRSVRLSSDGVVLDSPAVTIARSSSSWDRTCVVWNGTSFLVVWSDDSVIVAMRLDGSGATLDTGPILIANGSGSKTNPAVCSDGRDFFVAWEREEGGIHGAIVTSDGTVAGTLVVSFVGSEPALAFDGADYLVAYSTLDRIRVRRVSTMGVVLDSEPLTLGRGPNCLSPAVASLDTVSLVVWSDGGGAHKVHGARISTDGAVINASAIPISRPDPSRSRCR